MPRAVYSIGYSRRCNPSLPVAVSPLRTFRMTRKRNLKPKKGDTLCMETFHLVAQARTILTVSYRATHH